MNSLKRSISVVIPNYNGKDLLESNIPHVYNALKTSGITDFEIIISDDASKDQSVNFLKKNYPEIILIENKTNKGFSGNTNSGIFRATKSLVLILNSDVVLTDHYFEYLIPYFDSSCTFGVMGRIVSPDSRTIQDGAKYPASVFGRIRAGTNYLIKDQSSHLSLFLLGANALVDREKLFEIGGFDEIFNPYNSEDVDLGLRAWRLGYKCYYEHRAICKHQFSTTLKKEPNQKVKMISNRNVMILHYIHLNTQESIYYFTSLIFRTFFRTLMLDTLFLKSFYMFLFSINDCKNSKAKFTMLQQQKDIDTSFRDVTGLILQRIGQSTIRKF